MQINFYQCKSDKRVINKTLDLQFTLPNCGLIEPSSAINPEFTITKTPGLYQYNYVYIPYFSRYYYITDMIDLDGNAMKIKCHVDVLMSFKDQILECDINSRRTENSYDMYLPDNRTIESRYIRYSKKFPHSFKDERASYVLITVGNGDVNLV